VGHASGVGHDVEPLIGQPINDFLKNLGFSCHEVAKASDCDCKGDKKMIVVPYKGYSDLSAKWSNFSQDIHAFRDNNGTWDSVMGNYPISVYNWFSQLPVDAPNSPIKSQPNPDDFAKLWKAKLYCCCKCKGK
jgi:hypothetical protein